MNKIEKQFKEDFEKSQKVELSFDTSKLEQGPKPIRHKVRKRWILIPAISGGIVCSLVLGVSIAVFNSMASDSVREFKKQYTVKEIKIAENNTFKKLNSVNYPNGENPTANGLSEAETTAYNNFSNSIYHSVVNTSKEDNMSYSPIGLYSIINELEGAASRDDLKARLNNLLGLDEESRISFYNKVIQANSYGRENATAQIKNSAFFNNQFDYSREYVEYLTKLYCEAYQINFSKDADKMVSWVNQAVKTDRFIDKSFLQLNDDTQLYYFSTLYFKNAWNQKYLSKNNIKDVFHLENGKTVKATFMSHSYFTPCYYDYGTYISFKDYYYGGASVTYLIPKKVNDSIFELTKGFNIFQEKEGNKVLPSSTSYAGIKVNLKTPKFNVTSDINYLDTMINLGLGDMYDSSYDSFHNAFQGEDIKDLNFYLQVLKSKSQVEFNEDGSTIKVVTMGANGAESYPGKKQDTIDVQLNQPFIYIIRDINDMPIFVGHVDNPNAK